MTSRLTCDSDYNLREVLRDAVECSRELADGDESCYTTPITTHARSIVDYQYGAFDTAILRDTAFGQVDETENETERD